ncbi:hypothetical protein Tco_1121594 [Tanacetum coccineum]|uniref:Uncharacterized protein n=1 Tax=Tanacetum coccineum TaxID=301880 RepID=A0ABQ5IYD1_9ASTR
MLATTEALIAEYASAPTPSSPPPSPLSRKSSAAATARQPELEITHAIDIVDATAGRLMSREVGYGIEEVWDDMVGDMEERTVTTIEGLSQRVTYLSTTLARDTHEIYYMLSSKHIEHKFKQHEIQIQTRDTRIGSLETLVVTLLADCRDFVHHLAILYGMLSIIAQGVATALAEYEATRGSGNGDDNHDSRSGRRRQAPLTRNPEYHYVGLYNTVEWGGTGYAAQGPRSGLDEATCRQTLVSCCGEGRFEDAVMGPVRDD